MANKKQSKKKSKDTITLAKEEGVENIERVKQILADIAKAKKNKLDKIKELEGKNSK
jgi:hypothetical protein